MRRVAITALCALGLSGGAKADIALDFAYAYAQVYGAGEADLIDAATRGLNLLPRLEGRWVRSDIVLNGPVYDADRVVRTCGTNALGIARDGAYGFTTRSVARGEPQADVTTYAFAHGVYFARVTNLDGLAERIFGDRDLSHMEPSLLLSSLFQANRHSLARVEMVGPDVLIIEAVGGPTMVMTRCP